VGGLAALGLILWKAKALIVLGLGKLKFILAGLKFLSLGKVLTTGGTMILTIWVYAQTYGFAYAAGFVLLIFLHEMGHAAAIRMHGLEAGAPVFIPFVGAMIAMKKMPPNVRVEAEVAIAGPIAGGLAAAACWALGVALGSPLLHALAFSGFLLNLFNLLPVSPLDGGRIVGAISRWLWVGGLAVALAMAIVTGHFLLWLVVILGAVRAVSTFRGTASEPPGYFEIRPLERGLIAVGYFGLAALLAVGTVALSPRG
jgi:Zn-dependent protease